jgi:hypothetical protein
MAGDPSIVHWEWLLRDSLNEGEASLPFFVLAGRGAATQDNPNVSPGKASQCHKTQSCFNYQKHMFIDTARLR